jgi:integrase
MSESSDRRRRAKGEGTVYQDADGTWIGQLDLGRGPDGRRQRRKVTGPNKTAVTRKLRALRQRHAEGLDIVRARTVEVVAREWLAKAASQRQAPSTLSQTTSRVLGHLIPGVGYHRVDQLRPEDVEAWLADEAGNGAARRTVETYRGDLRGVLAWAMRRRLVSWNVAAVAELPDARPPRERRSLTPEQAAAFLAALDGDRHGPYFTVLLLCGLRPGEADALAWEDVDLPARTIYIHRAMQRASGGRALAIGPTKTKSVRTLAVPDAVADALHRQRAQQAAERLAAGPYWSNAWPGLVFVSELGTPMYPSNVRRAFDTALRRAGLPRFVPYELRHSAASLLVAAGVEPFEAADLLGHADLRMLERHYRHRLTPVVRGAEQLERITKG